MRGGGIRILERLGCIMAQKRLGNTGVDAVPSSVQKQFYVAFHLLLNYPYYYNIFSNSNLYSDTNLIFPLIH